MCSQFHASKRDLMFSQAPPQVLALLRLAFIVPLEKGHTYNYIAPLFQHGVAKMGGAIQNIRLVDARALVDTVVHRPVNSSATRRPSDKTSSTSTDMVLSAVSASSLAPL